MSIERAVAAVRYAFLEARIAPPRAMSFDYQTLCDIRSRSTTLPDGKICGIEIRACDDGTDWQMKYGEARQEIERLKSALDTAERMIVALATTKDI